jgi:hypothetical protein
VSRFLVVCLSVLTIAGVCAPSTAAADGLPVGNVDAGPGGVASRSGDVRYLALPAGQNTFALAARRNGGQVRNFRLLRGRYAVPVVALDGTADGLSADGGTLVLIRPRAGFPRARTTFAIVDTQQLRTREIVRLRGDFSYDAISPDGGLVYLIQYTSRRDPTRYDVRAYDTRTRRLLPDPIVDPREPGEEMRGYPITRAMSSDGQWAYTLYDGAGKHPFVHALNTRDLTAACIDLDSLTGRKDLMGLGLGVTRGGDELSVLDPQNRPLAVVDTQTFRVSDPAAGQARSADGGSGVSPGLWVAGVALGLSVGAILLAMRRRRAVTAT